MTFRRPHMISEYQAPVITDEDAKLPLCVVTVGHYPQCKINRPSGIPHYQILITTEGSGLLHLGKKKYTLTKNSILLLPPNTPQKYQPIIDWTTMYISYTLNWSTSYFSLPADVLYLENTDKYQSLILQMLSLNSDSNFCRESSPLLYELLLTLRSEFEGGSYHNDRLEYVHTYIIEHFIEDLDLSSLSGMCGLVPEYFSRTYKKIYKMGPIEHMHKLRMQEAKKKLIFTDMPLSKIANLVGYKSPSHFGSLFKQKEGITPNHFRKLYQQF